MSTEELFEYFLVVTLDKGKEPPKPEITFQFPEKITEKAVVQFIPQFCFPEQDELTKPEALKTDQVVESFSFVSTVSDGGKRYGYCRRYLYADKTRPPVCYCLLSFCASFSLFSQILDVVELKFNEGHRSVFTFLHSILIQPFPAPGETVVAKTMSFAKNENGEEDFQPEVFRLTRSDNDYEYLEYVTWEPLFQALDVDKILFIFECLVMERRIIVSAQTVSTLSACVNAIANMAFPFSWQYVFIPILPKSMISFLSAPMPFLMGILSSSMPLVEKEPIEEEVLMVDLDKGTFTRTPARSDAMPSSLVSSMARSLRKIWKSGNRGVEFNLPIAHTFLRFFSSIFSDYGKYFAPDFSFRFEKFAKSKSSETRKFLLEFSEVQMFASFIQERELMAKKGLLPHCILQRVTQEELKRKITAEVSKSAPHPQTVKGMFQALVSGGRDHHDSTTKRDGSLVNGGATRSKDGIQRSESMKEPSSGSSRPPIPPKPQRYITEKPPKPPKPANAKLMEMRQRAGTIAPSKLSEANLDIMEQEEVRKRHSVEPLSLPSLDTSKALSLSTGGDEPPMSPNQRKMMEKEALKISRLHIAAGAFDLINDKVESSSEGSPRLTSPTTSDRDTDGSVAADLALLYNNKDYSDCKIASTKDDTTFHGYRPVLVALIPEFAQYFKGKEEAGATVSIPLGSRVIDAILRFAFREEINISMFTVEDEVELLAFPSSNMARLKNACFKEIVKFKLRRRTFGSYVKACKAILESDHPNIPSHISRLRDACVHYFAKNTSSLLKHMDKHTEKAVDSNMIVSVLAAKEDPSKLRRLEELVESTCMDLENAAEANGLKALSTLYDTAKTTGDVTILVPGSSKLAIKLHFGVLAARCPYFQQLFSSRKSETKDDQQIKVLDVISEQQWTHLLYFIYHNSFSQLGDDQAELESLMEAAHLLQMNTKLLRRALYVAAGASLTPASVFNFLAHAEESNSALLQSAAQYYIAVNLSRVLELNKLQSADTKTLLAIARVYCEISD